MKHPNSMIKTFATLCGVALACHALAADRPGKRDPGVNARQHAQQKRVHQGVHSGQLTKGEAKTLHQEQKALRAEERAYKSDGKLTLQERKDLHQDANQLSKDIYRQKHDGQTRPPTPRHPHDPAVNIHQHAQKDRIARGVKSGQLTKEEAAQLRQQQRAIRAEERAYKSDGKLTVEERKDLKQDINQANKAIYQETHDDQTRKSATPPAPKQPAPPPSE
jgi:Skp family chaperone for outer membrane proteins